MKNIFSFVILLIITACSIDNYEMPNAKLAGKVIDAETKEMIENGGVNNGTLINLFEEESNQPIVTYSYPDGKFVNNALFKGDYFIKTVGAFSMMQENIKLSIESSIDDLVIEVLPNVRIKTTLLDFNGSTAKVKVDYIKVHDEQIIKELAITWSTIPNPNIYTSYGGGVTIEPVTSHNLASGEHVFTIPNLKSDVKYYIRAAAQTNAPGGYYNYSKTISTL